MLYLSIQLLTLKLFKNGDDKYGKLRLNFHSLSVSVIELLEYGCKCSNAPFFFLLLLFMKSRPYYYIPYLNSSLLFWLFRMISTIGT